MKQVFRTKDKAVSPIIATILLVAITVVLAATLYTILGNYTLFLGSSTPTASIQVKNASTSTTPYYFVYVDQFNGNVSLNDVQMRITSSSNQIYLTSLVPGQKINVANEWNITVQGSQYFTASTSLSIQGSLAHPLPFIKQIQFIDLKTSGMIAQGTAQ